MSNFFSNPLRVPFRKRLLALIWALFVITSLSLLSPYHWLADLLTHFRYQYFLSALLLLLICLATPKLRKIPLFSPLTLVIIINLFLIISIIPSQKNSSLHSANSSPNITLLSFNVLVSNHKHQQIKELISRHQPDIIWLMEPSSQLIKHLSSLSTNYPYQYNNPQPHGFGCLLWSQYPITQHDTLVKYHLDRFILDTPKSSLELFGTHPFPPMSSQSTVTRNQVIDAITPSSSHPTIICGDFNATPWSHPMRTLLKNTSLQYANQSKLLRPTWQAPILPFLTAIPIDHTLHSPQIHIHDYEVGSSCGSDHRPLITTFSLK